VRAKIYNITNKMDIPASFDLVNRIIFLFSHYLLLIKEINKKLIEIWSRLMVATARYYNRVASFGVNVLTIRIDFAGRNN